MSQQHQGHITFRKWWNVGFIIGVLQKYLLLALGFLESHSMLNNFNDKDKYHQRMLGFSMSTHWSLGISILSGHTPVPALALCSVLLHSAFSLWNFWLFCDSVFRLCRMVWTFVVPLSTVVSGKNGCHELGHWGVLQTGRDMEAAHSGFKFEVREKKAVCNVEDSYTRISCATCLSTPRTQQICLIFLPLLLSLSFIGV